MAIKDFFEKTFSNKKLSNDSDLVDKIAGLQKISIRGKEYLIPKNFSVEDDLIPFTQYWTNSNIPGSEYDAKRLQYYEMYKRLDEELSEITMTLDTYADEMFSVGFIDNPIEIKFDGVDRRIQDKVKRILNDNNILASHRADGRNLCKFGDIGYRIHLPKDKNPENIVLTSILPDKWRAVITDPITKLVKGYELADGFEETHITNSFQNKDLSVCEFVQFTIPDNEHAPYGRGLLDGLRNPSDHLMTVEALLALSRASKVERLVLRVPVEGSNPTSAFAQLNMTKSQWKNLIFKDNSGNMKTSNKTQSLQEIIYLPAIDGFSMDKLQSSIDLSSTEDVEYFRDKLLLATRLPKGYFTSDDTVDRGGALAAMDLKFARALVPYQRAYAQGLTKMCIILCYFVSKFDAIALDLDKINVIVNIKKSPQIATGLLDVYSKIIDTADRMFQVYKDHNTTSDDEGNETVPEIDVNAYKDILMKLGMPEDIAETFLTNDNASKKEKQKEVISIKENTIHYSSKNVSSEFKKKISESIDIRYDENLRNL
jgi:hypothetical protein